ncbi:MAG: hypothetical protein Athens071424_107 [Parcubacteria group bacterium Athens0714_24]|nr:MAG: hypothetical protein Athens071424_107 [Parcubacteria group bacterium Athens0714_24]
MRIIKIVFLAVLSLLVVISASLLVFGIILLGPDLVESLTNAPSWVPILLGVGLALVVMSPILLPIILRWIADRDFFLTLVNEGEWKAVVRAGSFRKGLMAYKGYTEDEKGNIVEELKKEKKRKKLGGIRWLGIPTVDEIHRYNFRWVVTRNIKVNEEKPEEGFVSQKELPNGQWAVSFSKQLDYIYLRDANYLIILRDADVKDSWMPVTIYAVVTLRILNPYKALFRVDKWLDVTLFAIESALRSWVAWNKYDAVLQKKEVLEHDKDEAFLKSLTGGGMQLTEYVLDRYGAQVKRIQFLEVELPEGFTKQATAQAAADREALRIATLRDAEYDRFKKITLAVKEEGLQGEMVFAGETIREASKGQATKLFLPFGSIQGFIEGLLGKKGGS